MKIRRTVLCRFVLLSILLLAAGSGSVSAQGGTGKLPPIHRMPPSPVRKLPPKRTPPPEHRPEIGEIRVTAAGSLSTTDRVPETLGEFRRNTLETNPSDETSKEYGAVEVLRAGYDGDILIFLSRFPDSATANSTMQTLARTDAGSYQTVSRKHIKNRAGRTVGEFWLMKSSGKEKKAYLLVTNATHLYRVTGPTTDDVQKVFKSLPLE